MPFEPGAAEGDKLRALKLSILIHFADLKFVNLGTQTPGKPQEFADYD